MILEDVIQKECGPCHAIADHGRSCTFAAGVVVELDREATWKASRNNGTVGRMSQPVHAM